MQKKLSLVVVLLLVATLAFASVAMAQGTDEEEPTLVRLEVRNRTDRIVSIVLILTDPETKGDVFANALTISANTTQTFTMPRGAYDHTTYACGESVTGTLDLSRNTRLIFVQCNKPITRQGEPGMEKISIGEDIPSGKNFGYKID
ncbi:MAG TPA: hypothetical protein VJ436_07805 [Anaerolineales bacterium]|nr:hypothetical protein [Anaerolineales bacterium]